LGRSEALTEISNWKIYDFQIFKFLGRSEALTEISNWKIYDFQIFTIWEEAKRLPK
jgi:hypothetical protein